MEYANPPTNPPYHDIPYLGLLVEILNKGVFKGDRTGTGTQSLFGAQIRFNLEDGFPLLTTKKMFLRGIIHELLWFLSGDTNVKYLQDRKVRIWNEWADEEGNLPKIYGHQWIRWQPPEEIVKVDPRIIDDFGSTSMPLWPLLEPAKVEHDLIGQEFECSNGQIAKVVDVEPLKRNNIKIQFALTGYMTNVRRDALLAGRVKDPYSPSVCEIGYVGNYQIKTDLDRNLKKTWQHMIERCYNPNIKEYKLYGAKGIKVVTRWHNFSNFVQDVKKLPNWHKKQSEPNLYQLDKDYYSSNGYSPNTCVWLLKSRNSLYTKSRAFKAISPDGVEHLGLNQSEFADKYNLNRSKISAVLRKEQHHHKNWRFEYLPNDSIFRYKLPINQIQQLVDQIKTNPNSRRIVLSAWNVADIEEMAIPPCHTLFQFYVANGKLSCQLYQRSADVFLGVPFNIASYALLTMMMAQVCDLQPGDFVHTFGDVHIYNNHRDQVALQLDRTPHESPKMRINPEVKDIFGFKYEDFTLENYVHHPAIKAPIAI